MDEVESVATTRPAKFLHQETDKELEALIKGAAAPSSSLLSVDYDGHDYDGDGLAPATFATAAWRATCVAALRRCLIGAQVGLDYAQVGLRQMQPLIGRSTRADFLQTLPELIGPPPERHWHEEWAALTTAFLSDQPRGAELASLSDAERQEYIETSPVYSIEVLLRESASLISNLVERRGWERRHAEAYTLLYPLRAPLSSALARRSNGFASSTYALSEALAASATRGEPLVDRVYKVPSRSFPPAPCMADGVAPARLAS